MARKVLRAGMVVTTTVAHPAYYSEYAGNPLCDFAPGDIGRIAHPDVPPVRGKRKSMVVIDFWKPGVGQFSRKAFGEETPHNGHAWRVALWPEEVKILPWPDLAPTFPIAEG